MNENGELFFRNIPDFDRPADSNRDNIYQLSVRASDGRAYGYLDVTVEVSNVNEHDPVVTGRNSLTVRENTTSSLYTYRATDGDRDTTITWSVSGTDRSRFVIIPQGVLSFRNPPDYDLTRDTGGNNRYDIVVEARDGGGRSGSLPVTVAVTELNEGPQVSGPSTFTIDENQDLASGTYTATDPEGSTTIRWGTSGRDAGDFLIDEGGTPTFRYLPDYERPADPNHDNTYELSVRAYDGRTCGYSPVTVAVRASDGRYYSYFNVTVTVGAVDVPPDITGPIGVIYRENGTNAVASYIAPPTRREAASSGG